ncbi:hypothetical protein FSP39_016626, partial [Pinctada imbricata]
VISNERRIKSLALKQIRKQVARLTQLQTIELSIVFCVVDKSQKRQLSKYCGKGDLLDKLKLSRPLLDKNELKQSRAWDEEVFIPKSIKKMAVPTVTPTKLPCGQGLPRSIAKRQRDLLETTVIATSGNDQNDQLISIDIDTPPRRKKTTRRQLGKGKSNQTKNNRKKRIDNTTCTSSSSSSESEGETNQPQEENPIHTVSVDDPDIGNFMMSATNGRRSPKILGKTKGYNGDFCSVPDCSNSRGKCNRMGKKVSFYQFPKDEKRREAWLRVIRRDSVIVTDGVQKTVPFTPNKSSRVCSEHFVEGKNYIFLISVFYYI